MVIFVELNLEKNTITLYGKSYKYDILLKKLSNLPGEDIYQFISNRGIALPRRMNNMAMISVLNERIKYLHSKSLTKEYFASLAYYKNFSELQLADLFKAICNDEDFNNYRYNLMNLIMINYEGLSLNDGEIQYLKNLKKNSTESFEDYENYISACSLEEEGCFDGVEIEALKQNLLLSATSDEILRIGNKYGIEIPENLTKEQYYDFIIYYLKKKDEYNEDVDNELSNMSLASLSTYSRRVGIPLQPTLNKEDYITYLFYYLDGCDISTTNIEEIIADDRYIPLDFNFDLSKINPLGDTEAVRIVSFVGDDDPEYVNKMEEILNEANKPIVLEEEKSDDNLIVPLRPGEKTMDDDVDSDDIELEEFEIEIDKELEEKKAIEEEHEEFVLEEEKVEPKEEPVVEKIDISKVIKNEEYGSKKLKNLKHGNRNIIILSVVISFVVLVLGFVIYALVR